jgi:rhamnosyl/mannosyltransferase
MKVLHVYKFYRPVHGGGITAMNSIIRGMPDDVESRVLVALGPGRGRLEPEEERCVRRVTSLGYWYSMPLAPTLPLWFAYEARKADIVHLHLPFPIADLALYLFDPGVPIVVHWHSDIVQQVNTKRLLEPLLKRTLTRANKILVGSPRHMVSSEDLRPYRDKCEVVPYGIDAGSWHHSDQSTEWSIAALRKRYPNMVFFAGRLVAYKGLQVLIKAMRKVDGNLVIAGEGPMRPVLARLAEKFKVSRKVHWVGALSDDELREHYQACSVFVLPSIFKNEAFGLVQLEAMACGKPVINTDLPSGVPWVARHEKEGLTVPPKDPKALAEAINRLLADPQLAQRLGEAGRHRVDTMFDIHTTGARVYNVYRQLLQSYGSQAQVVHQRET